MLKADIKKYIPDVAVLTKVIADHDDDIAVWTDDNNAATKVRIVEKVDYDTTHKDYPESIDALERVTTLLERQAYDRRQASFAQVVSLQKLNMIPENAMRTIDAFLQQEPDEGLSVNTPEDYGYEFQSQSVI